VTPRALGRIATREPSIVGSSESLASPWVELVLPAEEWAGYRFRLRFGDDGQLRGVEVHREARASELSAARHQRVPLGTLERTARRHLRDQFDPFIEILGPESTARNQIKNIAQGPKRPDDRAVRLAELAMRYVETLGDPYQVDILAEEFGCSDSTVPKWIAEARNEYHFLTPTKKGRGGGEVTPAAYQLLAQMSWNRLSDEQRNAVSSERAASSERAEASLRRYQRGEITHAQWELETFGMNFPRDEHGHIHMNFVNEEDPDD
jgi:hypothetical protein